MSNFVKCFLKKFLLRWLCAFPPLLICWITLTDFQILNQPWVPGEKYSWSWYSKLFRDCWMWLDNILLRVFVFISWKILVIFVSYLGIKAVLACTNNVNWKCFHIFYLLKEFVQFLYYFFLWWLIKFILKTFGPGIFFIVAINWNTLIGIWLLRISVSS